MIEQMKLTRRGWMRSMAGIGALGAAAAWRMPAARGNQAGADTAVAIGSRREMFVDDFLIGKLTGQARLRLHHPVAQEAAIVHDAAWEGTSSGYHCVFRDGDVYRMYYRGSDLGVHEGRIVINAHKPVTCYAESRDGIEWTKPSLGLIEFEGSKENNIIWDGVGVHNFAAFHDTRPDSPAESRYKALAGIRHEGGLFAFQSADGVRWSLLRDEPVITNGAFDSHNLAFWDPTLGKYRAYWRTFTAGVTTKEVWKPEGYRAVRTATSDDFLHWADEADLTYDDSPDEHLYTNHVKPYDRAPHILIGLPTRYIERGWSESMRALPELERRELRASSNERYGTAITEGLLMASRDGVRFKRWNEAFLRPGVARPGTWQYGQHYLAWHAVETKSRHDGAPNELSLYSTEDYWHGTGGTLRRYTLRLDGFVSAYAPMKGGELVTRPLTFDGSKLELNFATSAAGSVRVELQAADGAPIEGFSLADCPDHFGDTVDGTVKWKHGADVSRFSGRPVRVRFALKDADVYSFRFLV